MEMCAVNSFMFAIEAIKQMRAPRSRGGVESIAPVDLKIIALNALDRVLRLKQLPYRTSIASQNVL